MRTVRDEAGIAAPAVPGMSGSVSDFACPRCPPPADGRQVIWPQAPRSVYFDLAEIQPRCQPSLSVHHEAR